MEKFILELDNFIPKSLCNHLIQKFNNDSRKRVSITIESGRKVVKPDVKNSTELLISNLDDWKNEDTIISKYISDAIEKYHNFIRNNFNYKNSRHPFEMFLNQPIGDGGYIIQKQDRGAKYAWHYDWGPFDGSFILMIIYLNTLKSNEGGTTEFSNGKTVRPECGKILIFPASWTFPHCGNIVESDNKYIMTIPTFFKRSL